MNLDDLKHAKLRPTQTRVRYADGTVRVETKKGDIVCNAPKDHTLIEAAPDPFWCCVEPLLFIGSQDAAANMDDIRKNDIGAIVNCAHGPNYFPDKLSYLQIKLLDTLQQPLSPDILKQVCDFIAAAQQDNCAVGVHCNAGVSRSASLVIAFLMLRRNMSFQDAFEKVKQARPSICPNASFLEQLKRI